MAREKTTPESATRRKIYQGKLYECLPRYALDKFGRETSTLINRGCGRGFIYNGSCPHCGNRLQ